MCILNWGGGTNKYKRMMFKIWNGGRVEGVGCGYQKFKSFQPFLCQMFLEKGSMFWCSLKWPVLEILLNFRSKRGLTRDWWSKSKLMFNSFYRSYALTYMLLNIDCALSLRNQKYWGFKENAAILRKFRVSSKLDRRLLTCL